MKYFDEIQFIAAAELPECKYHIDRMISEHYSLEFIAEREMYFSMDDGISRILKGPCLHWHNIGHTYRYGPVNQSKGWRHLYFTFRGPRARRIMEDGLMNVSPECFQEVKSGVKLLPLFQKIIELINSRPVGYVPQACLHIEEIMVFLEKQVRADSISPDYRKLIQSLVDDILKNPCECLTVEESAESAGLSVPHFRKVFKAYLNKPFHKFVQEVRIRYAARMFREMNCQVKDIAEQLGYSELSDFSRTFKRVMGVSPKIYARDLII